MQLEVSKSAVGVSCRIVVCVSFAGAVCGGCCRRCCGSTLCAQQADSLVFHATVLVGVFIAVFSPLLFTRYHDVPFSSVVSIFVRCALRSSHT